MDSPGNPWQQDNGFLIGTPVRDSQVAARDRLAATPTPTAPVSTAAGEEEAAASPLQPAAVLTGGTVRSTRQRRAPDVAAQLMQQCAQWVPCRESHGRPCFRNASGYYCTYCTYTVCAPCLALVPRSFLFPDDDSDDDDVPTSTEEGDADGGSTEDAARPGDSAPEPSRATPTATRHTTLAAVEAALNTPTTAVSTSSASPTVGMGTRVGGGGTADPTLPQCHLCRTGYLVAEDALLHEWTCEGPAPEQRLRRKANIIYDTDILQRYHYAREQRQLRAACVEALSAQYHGMIPSPLLTPQPSRGHAVNALRGAEMSDAGGTEVLRCPRRPPCCEEGGSFIFSVTNPRLEQSCVWCAVNTLQRETHPAYHGDVTVTPLIRWKCPPTLSGLPPRRYRVGVPYGAYALSNTHALALYLTSDIFRKATTTVVGATGGLAPATVAPAGVEPLLWVHVLHHVASTPAPLPALLQVQGGLPHRPRSDGTEAGAARKRRRPEVSHRDTAQGSAPPPPPPAWPDGIASEELCACVDHLLQGRSVGVFGIGSKYFFLQHVAQSAELVTYGTVTVDATHGAGGHHTTLRQLREAQRRLTEAAAALRAGARAAGTVPSRSTAPARDGPIPPTTTDTSAPEAIDVDEGENSRSNNSPAHTATPLRDRSRSYRPTAASRWTQEADVPAAPSQGSASPTAEAADASPMPVLFPHAGRMLLGKGEASNLSAVRNASGGEKEDGDLWPFTPSTSIASAGASPSWSEEEGPMTCQIHCPRRSLDTVEGSASAVGADGGATYAAVAPTIVFTNDEARRAAAAQSQAAVASRRRCVRWATLPSATAARLLGGASPGWSRVRLLDVMGGPAGSAAPVTLLLVHGVDQLDAECTALLLRLCREYSGTSGLRLLVSFDDPRWPLTPLAASLDRLYLALVELRSLLLPRIHELRFLSSVSVLTAFEAAVAGGGPDKGGGSAGPAGLHSGGGGLLPFQDTIRRVLLSLPAAFASLLRIMIGTQERVGEGRHISVFTFCEDFDKNGILVSTGRLKALLRELTSNRLAVYMSGEHALMLPQHRKLLKVLEEVTEQREGGGDEQRGFATTTTTA